MVVLRDRQEKTLTLTPDGKRRSSRSSWSLLEPEPVRQGAIGGVAAEVGGSLSRTRGYNGSVRIARRTLQVLRCL